MADLPYLKAVQDQYDAYPYPPRNPEDEKVRLENCWHDFLELINFYCFQGRNNFSREFRVLVAGGGTGDQTIFLAEQLRHNRSAQIVHLDISGTSLAIAKRRADVRRLGNITWVQRSILELPSLGLSPFDFIDCTGVLHHLADPAAGLRTLRGVLKDDGAMLIMLYGKYGRTGVYQIQELMRRINVQATGLPAQVAATKAVLADLPASNWFKRGEDLIGDHREFGDAGIVDVFLHAQDRAFSVNEVYGLIEGCELQIIELIERGRYKYQPSWYVRDPRLLETIGRLPRPEQQAIAELLAGDIFVHNAYVARTADRTARLDELRNVPFYFLLSPGDIAALIDQRRGQSVKIEHTLFPSPIEFQPGPHTKQIFTYLDGERSLKEIFDQVRKDAGKSEQHLSNSDLLAEFEPIYRRFNDAGWMLLRHQSVGPFRTLQDMQRPL